MSPSRGGRAAYRVLSRELRRHRSTIGHIVGWSTVEALPSFLSGIAVSAAIDHFLARRIAAGFGSLCLLLAAAAIGAMSTRRLFPWLARLVEPVRDALVTAVVEGAVTEAVDSRSRPDTASVSRLTEQVQLVRNMLFGLLRSVRQTAFTFVAALIGLAVLAPAAGLVVGVPLALTLILFALLLPGMARRHKEVLVAGEHVARQAGTAFGGIRDIVACGGEERAMSEVCEAVDEETARIRAIGRATAVGRIIVFAGGQLPLVLLLAAAPWLVREGHLTPGNVLGAATYLLTSLEPALRSLVEVAWGWGIDFVVHLNRLGEGFVEPHASEKRPELTTGCWDLEARGLTFSYGPHAEPVVRDLDLTIGYGDHLAVMGPSGIGKSTLANLLVGLLDASRGTVRFGGLDVGEIQGRDLRRLFGLIPQEAYIFAGTLRENLLYLAPHATAPELSEAIRAVGLEPLVQRLGSLDALVGAGGAELSNGERQLIALVRVYLSPAKLVILDEATSNLDPIAEAQAEAAFAQREGTLVVIAHRVSSAGRAARILLLDGDQMHLGTHDELMNRSPLYADLVGHWYASDRHVSVTP